MGKKIIKYLSIITVLFMVLNSVPPLTVNATELSGEVGEEDINLLGEESSENIDLKVSSSEEDTEESTEETELQECTSEETEDDELEAEESESIESDESNSEDDSDESKQEDFKDCDSEEDSEDESSSETNPENESSDSAVEKKLEESTEENVDESGAEEDPSDSTEEDQSAVEDEANEKSQNELSEISLLSFKESRTSKLGHIKRENVKIYTDEKLSESFDAGKEYTHKVYYIKKQADIDGEDYYLISNSPSSVTGLVGWVKKKDLSVHNHKGHDRERKTFYFKGNGKTYSKAWGGSKDAVYNDLKPYQGVIFQVHLTEKVGNNIWYRGNVNGTTMWVHSSYVEEVKNANVSNTSKLGHIRSENVKIYNDLSLSNHKVAGIKYTHAVYYIKSEAKVGNQIYYLLSTSPSRTNNTVGWVKSNDISSHTHNGTDKTSKEFYLTGKGQAFTKAWGGPKDLVEDNLNKYKSQVFQVNLTERVGKNIWYRGTINGETAWVHSSYITSTKTESNTSRLGHLRNNTKIYKEIGKESAKLSTAKYTDAVYYIKKQAKINDDLFYLLSTSPSSTKGVIGWAKSTEIKTHTHNGTNKTKKTFYFNGEGRAFTKAWGGSKDRVHKSMKPFEKDLFEVNLTEKVGNNTWYRGIYQGKTVWVHSSSVNKDLTKNYDISLDEAVNIQMGASPQTDKRYGYVSRAYIKDSKVTASALNIRSGTHKSKRKLGTLKKGEAVKIISQPTNNWYQIEYNAAGWKDAAKADVKYHLDPKNFVQGKMQKFQFLDLAKSVKTTVNELNQNLENKGILAGKGKAFIEAGKIYNVNEIYLISHSLLETGNGKSVLAKGVEVGLNASGKATRVTSKNRSKLREIKVTYNMYGIGAFDSCALDCGATRAYEEKWFTPEIAIIEGAHFISRGYVNNGQNTIYKMRWDPLAMSTTKKYGKQYATDIGWATKQVRNIYNLYEEFGITNQHFEIPMYK